MRVCARLLGRGADLYWVEMETGVRVGVLMRKHKEFIGQFDCIAALSSVGQKQNCLSATFG